MGKSKKEIKVVLEIPQGVNVELVGPIVKVKGKSGEVAKKMSDPNITIRKEGTQFIIQALKKSKRQRKLVETFSAHAKNMFKSAEEGSRCVLKICSGHFPMNVSIKGNEFTVKNFFGEKIPRAIKLKTGAKVTVEGDLITVESPDKELSSQVAADIEKLTKRTQYDLRIFQDGIWIIEKDGKLLK
ncbi:MAG: 50S ribosomal protein L6 [Nanoarchaeota archaeon]|nr:50S ribosomal protein L6 [Nanoarchaeota archaeon]MBU1004871.1 50S ribosomal protein L6 [Nanoarchaeota archaeon]MBU1946317.1 50S ribosomal protein L6 [Nanoarchaeota archaeon]